MENNTQVPQKTKNRVTKWSCNPTPGHTSGENYNSKRYRHPNVHSSTIYNSQNMEATECPSAGKWIKNMWYKYTTEYYSFIENNEILPFAAKMDGPRDKLCLSGVRTVWVAMSCSSLQSVLRAFNPSPYPKDQGRSPRLRTQHARTVGECKLVSLFSTGNCHLARILWWVFFFFSVYAALWDSKSPHWPNLWDGFLLWGNFSSFTTPYPGGISFPEFSVSLFVFIFCPTSFWRDGVAFLGICSPLPAFRSCFVEVAPRVDNLLMYLWGRKWCSLAIPRPSWDRLPENIAVRERQTLYDIAYMWNLRKIQMKLSTKQK